MSDTEKDLTVEIARLNRLLSKRFSTRRMFLLGMVQGIGSAIGAVIIAGIVFAILAQFVQTLDIPEQFNPYIPQRIQPVISPGS